jgi:UDP-N-acetylglucosamine transferase subunit ALG13
MRMMAPLLEPERHTDAVWITHPAPQSRTMLAGDRAHFVEAVHPRDWRAALRRAPEILRILRRNGVDRVYSTGAGIAISTLPAARLVGARPRYIESLARTQGPSVTGKILQLLPWVPVFTQYPHNASRRWSYAFSLLDTFTAVEAREPSVPTRVFVTLGTQRDWRFRRLVDRVLDVLPDGAEVVWQTGATDVSDLGLAASALMSDEEFHAAVEAADVVISHAGVGTLLTCLSVGKVPVLVPRLARFGEHVDDHQRQIAALAAQRGLAVAAEADELTVDHLTRAASLQAVRTHADPGALV